MRKLLYSIVYTVLVLTSVSLSWAATDYHVGPDSADYPNIGDVPWATLMPGDRVYIHWRAEPYREKWVIARSGTAVEPIVVSGVPSADGMLPVVTGENATTPSPLNYTNEERGLIKIGSSNTPADILPEYIVIENLDLRSAHPDYSFTNDSGGTSTYSANAASIYVEKVRHLTIRNCIIHDSGNGIFIGTFGGATQDILIEKNYIYGNGIVGSYYEHNTYTEATDITYQYNHMGPLRSGAGGNNLKDRSAGLTVRYNWIENGNRQLDLVDSSTLSGLASYRSTYVYGNILVEAEGEGNNQILHYGGDSGNTSNYRKGRLHFFNNTLVSTRTASNTTVFRLSTDDETAEAFNNILYTTGSGTSLGLVGSSGHLALSHNWIKEGYRISFDGYDTDLLSDDGTNITGSTPGFANLAGQDFTLVSTSPAKDTGLAINSGTLGGHSLDMQYLVHQQGEPRPQDSTVDIGAFEHRSPVAKGDVDSDGNVDLIDAVLVLQAVSGKETAVPLYTQADVDGDGKLTLAEALFILKGLASSAEDYQPIALQSTVETVQPMTGIVFWADSENNASDSISLEYSYVGYDTVVGAGGSYTWTEFETLLDGIASRGHQAIVRFYFVYPGAATTVPLSVKGLEGYQETLGTSEGKATWFPDWTSAALQNFVLEFFTNFSLRYDADPRLAFLQVGFGLWGEYHIYDGPMTLGETFPGKNFQAAFLHHMDESFNELKWSISIDAADYETYSPFGEDESLLGLEFGLFDDSFLHATHDVYNRECFEFFTYTTRVKNNPMGGELNYYTAADQRDALDPDGPHGVSFETLASQYNISYMIGNDQPDYQTMERIREASMATGYRFHITAFESKPGGSKGFVQNDGIAPIYYDAYVAVNGVRSGQSLRGLMPGESLEFEVAAGGENPAVTIESDRLVAGQVIGFDADL